MVVKTRLLLIKVLISVMILLSLTMTGCSGNKQKENEPKPQALGAEQQGDKIPEQLTEIESNIESIFSELKGPAAETEDKKGGDKEKGGQEGQEGGGEKEKKTGGESEDKKSDEQSGGEEGGSQGGGGQEGSAGGEDKQKQDKQQSQPKQQPKQDPWKNVSTMINSLHYQWNNFMPLAAQKGANRTLMDNFSKALNSLTNTIIGKNSTNTLMAASYLYAYIPDFYSLYKTETSPEIKRIKYYTRNAMLNSWTANWTQADTDINALKSSWPIVKNTIPKDQQDNSNKLDYSLYELEKVIKEKNQPLIDIKGRVALSNIIAIEKGMQKGGGGTGGQSEGGGQSGGGEESGGGGSEGGSQ